LDDRGLPGSRLRCGAGGQARDAQDQVQEVVRGVDRDEPEEVAVAAEDDPQIAITV